MNSKINIIPGIFRKLFFSADNNQLLKFAIVFIIIAAILAFIHGSIKENALNATSIMVIIITIYQKL